jgi:hypothetical protein
MYLKRTKQNSIKNRDSWKKQKDAKKLLETGSSRDASTTSPFPFKI